jgi:hypothetical protein
MRLVDWDNLSEEPPRVQGHSHSISATPLHNYKQRLPNDQRVECQ